jgi:hypothetical protein
MKRVQNYKKINGSVYKDSFSTGTGSTDTGTVPVYDNVILETWRICSIFKNGCRAVTLPVIIWLSQMYR